MYEEINSYGILVRKYEVNWWLWRHMCENNIRMNVREALDDSVNWIRQTQDRNPWLAVVNTEMGLKIP
jgi:hypothetical protein